MSADSLEIRHLSGDDAGAISALLGRQPNSYREHFHPFADESRPVLAGVLNESVSDIYQGIFFESEVIAFYMLRGLDAGFERPSFGVLVDCAWRGRGLGRLCLVAALSQCRLRSFSACMLKVSPENDGARRLYESEGFVREGLCESTGHEMYSITFFSNSKGAS